MDGARRAVNDPRAVLSEAPRSMEGHVALVTGASSGIGEALARRIAREGRDLALVARRGDRLAALAREVERTSGVRAYALPVDLVRPAAVRALLGEIEARGLVVDWLVNNAAFGTTGRFDRLPVEREIEQVRLNVEVLVELAGRCLPGMVARGRGAVVNVASVAGFAPGPFMATYGATKAFVLSFTEALAAELRGTGVHVLCVCPGLTRTEFQERAAVDVSRVPSFAWMSAEEVADQAVRAVGRGPVLVNGLLNGLMASGMRLLPHGLTTRIVAGLVRPREAS
jgi:short-subunit dehydrogenase